MALRIEIVAAWGEGWPAEQAQRFRSGIESAANYLQDSLSGDYPTLQAEVIPVSESAIASGPSQQAQHAVAVLDVTACDERLAVLLGRLQGAGVACVVTCRTDSTEAIERLDCRQSEVFVYERLEELFAVDSSLQQELRRSIPEGLIREELVYQVWFPRTTSAIWVVCPQILEPGEFAERSNPDFTYLDNLGDTDALVEIMVFLSQYYPGATIERFSARDLPQGHTSGNLVVIGGPGSNDDISNVVCGEMMAAIKSRVRYSADCEEMLVRRGDSDDLVFRADYREANGTGGPGETLGLRHDRGYFARFPNPFNANASVVLVNGIHTAGVLGAARAFGERREALRNFLAVLGAQAPVSSFESHFEVRVFKGEVSVPTVDSSDVLAVGPDVAGSEEAISPSSSTATNSGNSVRVLFIAGDRGGSQVNQLQTPKEYHAIQAALRGSRHRDMIGLANPILGATRELLAVAYRERPDVVHFAGHGDQRSLSILEDNGVLVSEVDLTTEQLRQVLGAMESRVQLCVLNACESAEIAEGLVREGVVDSAVGWPDGVSDSSAIAFSAALYAALGDGRSVADAVDVARIACAPDTPTFASVHTESVGLLGPPHEEDQ